jgi:hypothetical protein
MLTLPRRGPRPRPPGAACFPGRPR